MPNHSLTSIHDGIGTITRMVTHLRHAYDRYAIIRKLPCSKAQLHEKWIEGPHTVSISNRTCPASLQVVERALLQM